jgi:3-deoxy-D-manno-octulosonic-acid transferase
MRLIYNLLLYLLLPFLPLRLLWKSRKNPAYRKRIRERFALFGIAPLKSSIWVHAVSVGEAISAAPLIQELLKRYPQEIIVVTTMTPTGADRIQKTFWGKVLQLYVPYDYPGAVQRFLQTINPRILIIMETELWPNLLHYTSKRQIPIILANARLSERSFEGYNKIRGLMRKMFSAISIVAAQSKLDADRFLALGIAPEKLQISGNVKFDLAVPTDLTANALLLREQWGGKMRQILVAASTHQGEEEKILAAAKIILAKLPHFLLVIVPRHPERFGEVYRLCCDHGFKAARYSAHGEITPEAQIIIGDVMGKMLLFYAAGDIAFVGGSLINWGGHNLLEPAVLAKPVISGPNLKAFIEISNLLDEAGALFKVADENELAATVIRLLQDEPLLMRAGAAAQRVVAEHRGATDKILNMVALYHDKTT